MLTLFKSRVPLKFCFVFDELKFSPVRLFPGNTPGEALNPMLFVFVCELDEYEPRSEVCVYVNGPPKVGNKYGGRLKLDPVSLSNIDSILRSPLLGETMGATWANDEVNPGWIEVVPVVIVSPIRDGIWLNRLLKLLPKLGMALKAALAFALIGGIPVLGKAGGPPNTLTDVPEYCCCCCADWVPDDCVYERYGYVAAGIDHWGGHWAGAARTCTANWIWNGKFRKSNWVRFGVLPVLPISERGYLWSCWIRIRNCTIKQLAA